MNPWPVVWAELKTTRAGAIAVVLLVALAVALGVAVSSQERALRQGSAAAADRFDIVIGARGSPTQLVLSSVYLQIAAVDLIPGRILAELQAAENVAVASPLGFGDNWRGHPVVGVTPEFIEALAGPGGLLEGRTIARIDEVVAGIDVDLGIGDSFAPTHGHAAVQGAQVHDDFDYVVVGRLPRLGNPWDRAIIGAIEAVWWLHSMPVGHTLDLAVLYPDGVAAGPDLGAVPVGPPWDAAELPGVPAIVVKPTTFGAAYQLRQQYRNDPDTMAVFPAEVLVQLYALLGDVRDLVAIISILTQVLVIGAVLLAVLASLAQRRRLIGVLRALGASRPFVFATVWTNVALLLTVGAVLGLVLGWLGAHGVSLIFAERTGIALPVRLSTSELRLVVTIIGVGLVLATLPAVLAYRGTVSAALRG